MDPLDQEKKISIYRSVYIALHFLGESNPEASISATAGIRLLMIDDLGEARQKELIGEWNSSIGRPE